MSLYPFHELHELAALSSPPPYSEIADFTANSNPPAYFDSKSTISNTHSHPFNTFATMSNNETVAFAPEKPSAPILPSAPSRPTYQPRATTTFSGPYTSFQTPYYYKHSEQELNSPSFQESFRKQVSNIAEGTSAIFENMAIRLADFKERFSEIQQQVQTTLDIGFKWQHLGMDLENPERYELTLEQNSSTYYDYQTNNELRFKHVALLVANIPFRVLNLVSFIVEKALRLTLITDIISRSFNSIHTPKYSLKERAIVWIKDLISIPAAIVTTAFFPLIGVLGAVGRPKDARRLYDLTSEIVPKTNFAPVKKLEIKMESFEPV